MLFETLSSKCEFVLDEDSDASAFSDPVPVNLSSKPTVGVVDMGGYGELQATNVQNGLKVIPIGVGDENGTFNIRVWGWNYAYDNEARDLIFWPDLLCELAVTLCAKVGVAGTVVSASHRFADSISLTVGNSNVSTEILAPGSDLIAHAVIDTKGAPFVTFDFDIGANVTAMNALVRQL